MSDDDEIICLDDDDDDMPIITETLQRNTGSVIQYSRGAEGSFDEPVLLSESDDEAPNHQMNLNIDSNRPTRRRAELISDDELPDIPSSGDESPGFSLPLKRAKKTAKKPTEKTKSAKIKLPKLLKKGGPPSLSTLTTSPTKRRQEENHNDVSSNDPDSPSKRSPKKKKTLADIVTDIHETSTDEIDSDEISASQQRLSSDPSPSTIASTMYNANSGANNHNEPQPCCSKSLQPQLMSRKKVEVARTRQELISSDEELPDIDEDAGIYLESRPKPTFGASSGNGSREGSRASRPTSTESTSRPSTTTSSSVSNSQASSTNSTTGQTKKQQKEVEAERKRREKELKKLEKERKKAEEAREKELKKVENELRRNTKPGEAFKFMTVVLDSLIVSKLDALVPQLVAAEIRYESKMGPLIENSITFQRELVHQAMNDELQLQRVSRTQEEDQLMIVIDSDQAIPMINAQLHKDKQNDEDLGIDLISWVESIKAICVGKKLTIFLYNMEKFFKKIRQKEQQEFRNRVQNAADGQPPKKTRRNIAKPLPQISKTELQSALIELQLQTGVNYRMVKDVVELGTAIVQYTKAIADAPFKKQRQETQGFDFFAMSDSAGSVRVEADGTGLRKLWIDQLQQFNNVGLDIATAIANKYPSPRSLIEAYQRCSNEDEGQSLVRDVSVTSGEGPLARKRKVGPELSKKMYRFFTSTNGDRFLGSTTDTR